MELGKDAHTLLHEPRGGAGCSKSLDYLIRYKLLSIVQHHFSYQEEVNAVNSIITKSFLISLPRRPPLTRKALSKILWLQKGFPSSIQLEKLKEMERYADKGSSG